MQRLERLADFCQSITQVALGFLSSAGIVYVLGVLGAGCHLGPAVNPSPDADAAPLPKFDAMAPPDLSDDCGRAEARLRPAPVGLGCTFKDGRPAWQTFEGGSWAVACRLAAHDPSPRDWHPGCIAKIPTCAELDAAFRGERCWP